ncbi:hypothetical protein BC629DRAFT_1559171 [Irpex lacteus]|nr:hypothetical protein BC629DRAFT_1559171 [Irpex lacteus]
MTLRKKEIFSDKALILVQQTLIDRVNSRSHSPITMGCEGLHKRDFISGLPATTKVNVQREMISETE